MWRSVARHSQIGECECDPCIAASFSYHIIDTSSMLLKLQGQRHAMLYEARNAPSVI